jgi:2-methylcitrate dehydratase PrpD
MMGAREFHPEHLLAGIGSTWEIMSMQIKPYAACRWMHSSIDAFRHLLSEVQANRIESVNVHIYNFGVSALSKPNPSTLLALQFSMPHIFGLLAEGNPIMDVRLEDAANTSAIAFSTKVSLHLDEEYDRQYTDEGKLPARVNVVLKDGEEFEKEVLSPVGEKGNPLIREDHLLKIRTLIESNPHRKVRRYARQFIPS